MGLLTREVGPLEFRQARQLGEVTSMHNIGSTQLEHTGHPDFGASQSGSSQELEELGEFGEFGELGEAHEGGSPFHEIQEMELASALLEVNSEEELEQFLGNLIDTVGGAARRFARSDTGQALGGILKGAARQALPVVGRAAGEWIGGRNGGRAGAQIATQAGKLFGLELEGLSGEDREFEVARQLVRFAGAAAQGARQAPRNAPPIEIARAAAANAARTYAPGLLPRLQGRSTYLWPRSGRWVRRGRTIVLLGG
jgi:hypothetical protein